MTSESIPAAVLNEDRVSLDNQAASKKKALEEAAVLLARGLEEPASDAIFERLLERERLGSTGLAHGVALPHARIEGIQQTRGALLRLHTAVDFDSLDGQPVDILFALLVPAEATSEHLQLLATLARIFSQPNNCAAIRAGETPAEVLALLLGEGGGHGLEDHGSGPLRRPA